MQEKQQKLEAKYGLFMGISMVVGQVIGAGIFFKVDDILFATKGNVYAGLLGFIVVGISIVFAGASMANYAKVSQRGGGILDYVEYRFGKKIAAYVGWVYLSIFFPLLTAVLFTVSGVYIVNFIKIFIHFEPSFLHFSLVGLFNGIIFWCINIFKPNFSGLFQQLTTILKLLPLILIAAIGIISFFNGSSELVNSSKSVVSKDEVSLFWVLVVSSFIPISFAMDGWYVATQISGELKNPDKNLPKSLIIGTMIVLLVYIFYYLGITSIISVEEMRIFEDSYITEFAKKISSEIGAIVIQLFIIISVLGTSNGLMLVAIRIPYQFYNLDHSKKFLNLGQINHKTKMPINSAIFAFVLIIFYFIAFYLTNEISFLAEKRYDISAIPIIFVYIVNVALFLGLFNLFRKNKLKGNKLWQYISLIFAILGSLLVLLGSVLSPNGLSYLVILLIFILLGRFVVKN